MRGVQERNRPAQESPAILNDHTDKVKETDQLL
jgi:hypothetical protein